MVRGFGLVLCHIKHCRLVMASDYQAELFLGIGEPFGSPFLTVSPFLMYFLLFGQFVQ